MSTNDYIDSEGQIFAIVGTGGQNFDPFSGKASFVVSQQNIKFGILDVKITNDGTRLEGKYYTNDGALFDQFSITKAAPPPPPPECTTGLPIGGVTASANDGNVPQNVLDNNLATRWSSLGIGQSITADLGSIQNICSVDIAWYNGNMRQYHFVIASLPMGPLLATSLAVIVVVPH